MFWYVKVIASLLITVLLIGLKLGSLKEVITVLHRQKELEDNIRLIEEQIEDQALKAWSDDVKYDEEGRDRRIVAMQSSGILHGEVENKALEQGMAMLSLRNRGGVAVTKLSHEETLLSKQLEVDPTTGRVIGTAEAIIRGAGPERIAAYMMEFSSRIIRSREDPEVDVINEVHLPGRGSPL